MRDQEGGYLMEQVEELREIVWEMREGVGQRAALQGYRKRKKLSNLN